MTSSVPSSDSASNPATVLLVHGFLDGARVWDAVRRQLDDLGVRSAVLDLPGMGGTSADPGAISLDSHAAVVAAHIDRLGVPVILVGQSMGAQTIELAAALRPEMVRALVLLTPVPLGGVGLSGEVLEQFRALGSDAEARHDQRVALSHDLDTAELEMLDELGSLVPPAMVARLVDIWNEGHSSGHLASTFSGPVIVVRGASDPFVTEAVASSVAERFEGAGVVSIEAAGHWAHVEQPASIASLLAGFAATAPWLGKHAAAGGDWMSAFSAKTQQAFGDAFAADIVLEATTLVRPVAGRDAVQQVMAAASSIYASLTFTDQASIGAKTYIEWVARAHDGTDFDGVTVLTRNHDGEIHRVAIHHRPMKAAIRFSRLMGASLASALPDGHFLSNTDLENAA